MTDTQIFILSITVITITALITFAIGLKSAIATALNYAIKFTIKQADSDKTQLDAQLKLAQLQSKIIPDSFDHEANPEITPPGYNPHPDETRSTGQGENVAL